MKTVIRTAETHPLTGVCAMTNSRYGSTNTRAKTAMPGRVKPWAAWRQTTSLTR